MNRLLASFATAGLGLAFGTSASAADISPVPVAPAPLSWTGVYFGVQGGGGWGDSDGSITGFQPCFGGGCGPVIVLSPGGLMRQTINTAGPHGGGTVGFNWQSGPAVLGVEGELSAADLDGTASCDDSFGFLAGAEASCHVKMTSYATAAGRLGGAIDHALLYVKAGGAWARFDEDVALGLVGFAQSASASIETDRFGYVVGAGVEYALWGGWSAKVEYDFMDFGTKNVDFPLSGPAIGGGLTVHTFVDDQERVQLIKAGLNWRFNWPGL
jgi:outer membrane immunogenic protein